VAPTLAPPPRSPTISVLALPVPVPVLQPELGLVRQQAVEKLPATLGRSMITRVGSLFPTPRRSTLVDLTRSSSTMGSMFTDVIWRGRARLVLTPNVSVLMRPLVRLTSLLA
jgi:hypothetical protein